MATKTIKLKTFLISLSLIILSETCCYVFMGNNMGLIRQGSLRLLELLFIFACVMILENGFASIGLSKHLFFTGIKKGLIWSFVFGIITCIGFSILILLKTNPFQLFRTRLPKEPITIALFFLIGGLIAPVVEEVFFRGILYGFLRRWGAAFAIVLSTLVFGFAHPGVSVVQLTGGIVFAISYEKEKNLMVPIIIHILANLSLFSLSLFT